MRTSGSAWAPPGGSGPASISPGKPSRARRSRPTAVPWENRRVNRARAAAAAAAASIAVAGVFVLVYIPQAISDLGENAANNAGLSYSDREIAGGNGIVVDQE